jgi:hypothetical protein
MTNERVLRSSARQANRLFRVENPPVVTHAVVVRCHHCRTLYGLVNNDPAEFDCLCGHRVSVPDRFRSDWPEVDIDRAKLSVIDEEELTVIWDISE